MDECLADRDGDRDARLRRSSAVPVDSWPGSEPGETGAHGDEHRVLVVQQRRGVEHARGDRAVRDFSRRAVSDDRVDVQSQPGGSESGRRPIHALPVPAELGPGGLVCGPGRRVWLVESHSARTVESDTESRPDRALDGVGAAAFLLRRFHLEGARALGPRVARLERPARPADSAIGAVRLGPWCEVGGLRRAGRLARARTGAGHDAGARARSRDRAGRAAQRRSAKQSRRRAARSGRRRRGHRAPAGGVTSRSQSRRSAFESWSGAGAPRPGRGRHRSLSAGASTRSEPDTGVLEPWERAAPAGAGP